MCKSIKKILLGFSFILSLSGQVFGTERSAGELSRDNFKNERDLSLQEMASFSKGKDQIPKRKHQAKTSSSDSDSLVYYLVGTGFIFFVGLSRRGVLDLFKY